MVKELQHTVSGVLNAASDGVFVSDTAGTIKYVNERAVAGIQGMQRNHRN